MESLKYCRSSYVSVFLSKKKRERESEFKLNYGGSSKVFIREFKRHFIKISYEK